MTLNELVRNAINKELFITIQNYIDFAKEYLEFIDNESNYQAKIIAQNENHYNFYQYLDNGTFNITRPINSNLMYSADDFEGILEDFANIIENIEDDSIDSAENRTIMNKVVYTVQQCIGCSLDALPANQSNTARKINGDLFERLIRQLLSDMNISCESGVVQIPVEVNNEFAFNMSYQHDLIIKSDNEIKAIGSVKTSSKDRLDKIFIDKFLFNRLTGRNTPHFAVFLNDVQRKNTARANQYSINATFLPGHFKGYTVKLNPLDGVYYCDIRPNMLTENILREHIKTFDHLIFEDIWEFL